MHIRITSYNGSAVSLVAVMQILNTDLAKNGDVTTLGGWKEGKRV